LGPEIASAAAFPLYRLKPCLDRRDSQAVVSEAAAAMSLWVDFHNHEAVRNLMQADFRLSASVDSPLYRLVEGSKAGIRCNPADPESYCFRELLKSPIQKVLSVAMTAVLFDRGAGILRLDANVRCSQMIAWA